jgi:hypothetical protein
VSADSTNNVVQIFGYFQDKRFARALEHLACAYEANLDAEAAILEAILQIGWEEENATDAENAYCVFVQVQADIVKQSGIAIRQIMRDITKGITYEDGESSESSD